MYFPPKYGGDRSREKLFGPEKINLVILCLSSFKHQPLLLIWVILDKYYQVLMERLKHTLGIHVSTQQKKKKKGAFQCKNLTHKKNARIELM